MYPTATGPKRDSSERKEQALGDPKETVDAPRDTIREAVRRTAGRDADDIQDH